ncbi:MAG TPA: GTP-binding protein, partial [bacterium]|nr:GTP-binding protein [bacterium]
DKVIASAENLSSEERDAVTPDLEELRKMREKLQNCRIEITAFGEVSTGKSSVLNALLGQPVFRTSAVHGETRNVSCEAWDSAVHRIDLPAGSSIRLVDTPGLNEVNGSERARMAWEMSRRSDLILFIIDSDMNHEEHQAFLELGRAEKPMILVLNQIDRMTEKQLRETRESVLNSKLPPQFDPEDLVLTAADPMEREVIVVQNGRERRERRKPEPRIDALRERIIRYLQQSGKALVALNASMFAGDVSERMATLRIRIRAREAESIIWKYAVAKGLAVGVNPIPVADMVGAAAADLMMIYHLGNIYGFEVSKMDAVRLWRDVLVGNLPLFGIEWVTHMLASTAKVGTYTLSTLFTGPPQAVAAGWASYILGQAVRTYYANNAAWGPGGPKTVIRNIFNQTDDTLIKKRLGRIISEKLGSRKKQPNGLSAWQ